ncbi:MAG: hypothetical protein WBO88_01695 [Candidatus Dechloromonas phosphoritropha]|jgi:hypothetical protein
MATEPHRPTAALNSGAARARLEAPSAGQVTLDLLLRSPSDDVHSPFVTLDRAYAYVPTSLCERNGDENEEKAAKDG